MFFFFFILFIFFYFFFQAEDGIRDHCVTGVQTCALRSCPRHEIRGHVRIRRESAPALILLACTGSKVCIGQIGRASCKGKSVDLGGRRIIKKKKRTKQKEKSKKLTPNTYH